MHSVAQSVEFSYVAALSVLKAFGIKPHLVWTSIFVYNNGRVKALKQRLHLIENRRR